MWIGKASNGYDFTPTGNSACGERIKNKVLWKSTIAERLNGYLKIMGITLSV